MLQYFYFQKIPIYINKRTIISQEVGRLHSFITIATFSHSSQELELYCFKL